MEPKDGTKKLFKELQKHRLIKGYSQEYMADRLGLSQRQYSRIDNGECKLDIQRLMTICMILDLRLEDVLPPDHLSGTE